MTREEEMKPTCRPDYEAECEKLRCELHRKTDENEGCKRLIETLSRENELLLAKMEMIELIFGGKK